MNMTKYTSRQEQSHGHVEFISVIVPVRNESTFIGKTLAALLSQDYSEDQFEIIVVDGCSTDDTRAIVAEYSARHSNVRLLENPRMWSSSARNIGIRASQGNIITVVDGHCDIPTDRYLANLATAFRESEAAIVGRPQSLHVDGGSPVQKAIAVARASWLGHHPDSFVYANVSRFVPAASVGTAYRKEVFDRIGYFDEAFDACEDVDFNTRADDAGESCYFTESVGIQYYPRESLSGLFQQMSRYGHGRVRLARKHPRTASLKSLLPGAFVVGLLLGPVFALLHWAFAIAFVACIVTYVLIVGVVSIWLAIRSRSPSHVWRLPAVFAAIHVGAGWGIVNEALSGWQRPRHRPFLKIAR